MSDEAIPELAEMEAAFREMLSDAPAVVIRQLAQMSLATKRGKVNEPCPDRTCNCKHIRWANIPDAAGAEKILRFVYEYGKGRPRAMEGDGVEGVVIKRIVRPREDGA